MIRNDSDFTYIHDSELGKLFWEKIFYAVQLLWNSRLIILENSFAFFYSLCQHSIDNENREKERKRRWNYKGRKRASSALPSNSRLVKHHCT